MADHSKHSPLPWKAHVEPKTHLTGTKTVYVVPAGSDDPVFDAIATMWTKEELDGEQANAGYIVKACNAYPKLVDALKKCVDHIPTVNNRHIETVALLRELGEL